MKILKIFITYLILISSLKSEDNLNFFLKRALSNNIELNVERKNLESSKQEKNISRSEFFPSVTISGDQTSTTSSNRTNQSGTALSDTNLDTENKSISIEQTLFSGFKGVNTFKKSELETRQAKLKLNRAEQRTILKTAHAYYDEYHKNDEPETGINDYHLRHQDKKLDQYCDNHPDALECRVYDE